MILEPFWPSVRAKIDKIQENIEHHKALLTANVTLEDISRAQRARKLALEEYDCAAKFREHQTFCTIRDQVIRPETYDEKLASILRETSKGSGAWLDQQDNFTGWLNPVDGTVRCLWLCGIPGAGMCQLPPRARCLTDGRQAKPTWLETLLADCREAGSVSFLPSSHTSSSLADGHWLFSNRSSSRLSRQTRHCSRCFPTCRTPTTRG